MMMRRKLQGVAAACMSALGVVLSVATTADAQTWRWNYVTLTPHAPPLAAQSTVDVRAGELQMTYTVPLARRQVVIESCRAALSDVASATTVHTQGRTYLLVQLKASRAASCASGKRPAVALPTNDARYVSAVAQAINRSCCSGVAATAKPATTPAPRAIVTGRIAQATPSPASAATPAPNPSPAPQPTAASLTADWVESEGLFSFVRVRNMSAAPVRIRNVETYACHDIEFGCGRTPREYLVDPHAVMTIVTVASSDQRNGPTYAYRYVAAQGITALTRNGSTAAAKPGRVTRMSAQEIRNAEAGALGALRSTVPDGAATIAPARLLKRGTSRLAIGETGTAVVRLMIAANGTPQEATIVSISNSRLAAAAIETAVSSTYAPATQNGKPVSAKYIATFGFDGSDPATASIPVWKRSPLPAPSSTSLPSALPPPMAAPSQTALPATSPVPAGSPSAITQPTPGTEHPMHASA